MNETIVILVLLVIMFSLIRISKNVKTITKKDQLNYLEEKLKQVKESKSSDGVSIFAFLVVFSCDVAIIYYSVSVILSLVKG